MPSKGEAHKTQSSTLFCKEISDKGLQAFWDLESVGISMDKEVEDPVVDQFKREVTKEGDRYSVALPWKENQKKYLVNNKKSALKRWQNLSIRLKRDTDLKINYHAVFSDKLEHRTCLAKHANRSSIKESFTFTVRL